MKRTGGFSLARPAHLAVPARPDVKDARGQGVAAAIVGAGSAVVTPKIIAMINFITNYERIMEASLKARRCCRRRKTRAVCKTHESPACENTSQLHASFTYVEIWPPLDNEDRPSIGLCLRALRRAVYTAGCRKPAEPESHVNDHDVEWTLISVLQNLDKTSRTSHRMRGTRRGHTQPGALYTAAVHPEPYYK